MANVYKTKLDIKNVRPSFTPIFVQYDHARLEIELLDNGQTYDLSAAERVEFTHFRGDEVVIIHPAEIVTNGNKKIIRYEYKGTEMDVLGVVKTSFAVFDANDKKVSSHIFDVVIEKDLRDETFSPAEPNLGLLQTLITDVEELKRTGGSGGIGTKGDPGYTPIKGVDYFDGRDGRNGLDGYTPIKGVDYFDGKDGEKGAPFTYADFTPSQLEALRGPKGDKGETGEAGLTIEEVRDELSILSSDKIKAPEYNVGEVEVEETNIPFTLIQGFLNSTNAALDSSAPLWRTLSGMVPNNGENTYKVKTTVSGATIRVLFASNVFLGSTVYAVNEEFTLPENVTQFSINFTLPNAVPASSLVPFPDIESLNGAKLVKVTKQGEISGNATVSDALASIEKRLSITNKSLKVLMLGNSFSEDVSQYIHNIANSAGVNAIFGNLYRPGESLEGHWNQINAEANSYTFHIRSSLNGVINHTQTENTSFLDALTEHDWDVITYQQASPMSGMYENFKPFLADIIEFVNENKTNPNLRHALHMTWAYPTTSSEPGFANYDNNQQTMYAAIVNAYQQAMFDNDIDLIIPVGTAIQNARSISYLQSLHNDLASDGYHLGAAGDFIGGLTIFETLIAKKYKKDIFENVKISLPNAKYHAYLSKLAVKNAVLNPFNVTDI